jgi:hypothetical protein
VKPEQIFERATQLLEHILEWPDEELALLDSAGRADLAALFDVLNMLQQVAHAADDGDRLMFIQTVASLEEHVRAMEASLPAEPDFFAGQGHLGAVFDDLSEPDQGAISDPLQNQSFLPYFHNTLLECREKLVRVVQDPTDPAPRDTLPAQKGKDEATQ